MKRNEMADKIYDILEKRWQNQFEDLCDSEWKDFLSKHGIDLRGLRCGSRICYV